MQLNNIIRVGVLGFIAPAVVLAVDPSAGATGSSAHSTQCDTDLKTFHDDANNCVKGLFNADGTVNEAAMPSVPTKDQLTCLCTGAVNTAAQAVMTSCAADTSVTAFVGQLMTTCSSGMAAVGGTMMSSMMSSMMPSGASGSPAPTETGMMGAADPATECATAYYTWVTDINTCAPGAIDMTTGVTSVLSNLTVPQVSCICQGQIEKDSMALAAGCANIDMNAAAAAVYLSGYLNGTCSTISSMTGSSLPSPIAMPTFSAPASVSAVVSKASGTPAASNTPASKNGKSSAISTSAVGSSVMVVLAAVGAIAVAMF
ncbi:hypothetical protein HDU76_001154 [Blyttiomyces sp. JEL0837]|nr:hypothetical protein HDU76_001154 [Blyttiomyces sp. JEL0837]